MSILTELQVQVLKLLCEQDTIVRGFYWTGGTVLSEFYLHHRLSEDIDLFSEHQEVQIAPVQTYMKTIAKKTDALSTEYSNYLGLHTFILKYPTTNLKIDFNYYPFPRVGEGKKYKTLEYDSIEDIIINKMQTIGTKPRSRDFIDLFFAMKQVNMDIDTLLIKTRAKFDWYISPLQYASNFIKAFDIYDESLLLKPLDKGEYEDFYNTMLSELGKKTFK